MTAASMTLSELLARVGLAAYVPKFEAEKITLGKYFVARYATLTAKAEALCAVHNAVNTLTMRPTTGQAQQQPQHKMQHKIFRFRFCFCCSGYWPFIRGRLRTYWRSTWCCRPQPACHAAVIS